MPHLIVCAFRFFFLFLSLSPFCLASSYFARTNPPTKKMHTKKNSISAVDAAVTTPTGRPGAAPPGAAKKAEAAAGPVRPASADATLATSPHRYGRAGPPSRSCFIHRIHRLCHHRFINSAAPEFGSRPGRPLRVEEG